VEAARAGSRLAARAGSRLEPAVGSRLFPAQPVLFGPRRAPSSLLGGCRQVSRPDGHEHMRATCARTHTSHLPMVHLKTKCCSGAGGRGAARRGAAVGVVRTSHVRLVLWRFSRASAAGGGHRDGQSGACAFELGHLVRSGQSAHRTTWRSISGEVDYVIVRVVVRQRPLALRRYPRQCRVPRSHRAGRYAVYGLRCLAPGSTGSQARPGARGGGCGPLGAVVHGAGRGGKGGMCRSTSALTIATPGLAAVN
jgi:hypothetical protein